MHSQELDTSPIIFIMCACMKQLGTQWMNFHYTLYCGLLLKSIMAIQFWFKLNKNWTLYMQTQMKLLRASLSLLFHYESTLGLPWQWGLKMRLEATPKTLSTTTLNIPTASNIINHKIKFYLPMMSGRATSITSMTLHFKIAHAYHSNN